MDNKQVRSVFNRIGLSIALFIFVSNAVSSLISLCFERFDIVISSDLNIWLIINYVIMYFMGFPVMMAVFSTIPNGDAIIENPVKFSFWGILKTFVVLYTILLPIAFVSNIMTMILDLIFDKAIPFSQAVSSVDTSGYNLIINFIIMVIVAPVMEELIFRKILYNKLIKFGGKTYILVSGIMFGMVHGNLSQMFYATVLGIIFAYIYQQTKKLSYVIILHSMVNFIGGIVGMFISEKAWENESILLYYLCFISVIVGFGIGFGVVWLLYGRKSLKFTKPAISIQNKKVIVLNFGMILFAFIIAGLVILNILL